MHTNHTATADLVLDHLPNGELAWLRPEPDATWVKRADWPTFVVQSETVYQVAAPSAERVLQWFADTNDTDLDVVTLDFGTVEVFSQLNPDGKPEDTRYVLTDQARRDLAIARLFDHGPTVAEVTSHSPAQSPLARFAERFATASRPIALPARCPACHELHSAPGCAQREHWGV